MLQIKPKNIIPITEARGKLDNLINEAKGSNFFVISRQGKPKAALIDLEYIMELEKKLDFTTWKQLREEMQSDFKKYLTNKGYDPKKMTEEEVYKIIESI
jgi:prevent-host-death family protein